MVEFLKWVVSPENINANIFTLISVVLSGIISWIISAIYYRFGNRNALKSTILHPIQRLLEDKLSFANYRTMVKLSKEHYIKYIKADEKKCIDELFLSYKEVCRYNYETVCAESLSSYFKYKLKKNNIDPSPIPVYVNDELVYTEPPTEMIYFIDDLARVVTQYPPEYDTNKCQESIVNLFNHYCKTYYSEQAIN